MTLNLPLMRNNITRDDLDVVIAYLQQEDPVMAQQYILQFQTDLDNIGRRYNDTPAPQPMVANSRIATRYAVGTGGLRYASTGGVIW